MLRKSQERICGHTARQWYGFYRHPHLYQGDLASDVTVALLEVSSADEENPGIVLNNRLTALLAIDSRETVRCLAAVKLGLDKTMDGEPALLAALHDESEIVRRCAAISLVALNTVRGLSAVVAGSRHGCAVRTQAAHGLREHGRAATEAIPSLLCLLRDRRINWRSHSAAVGALVAIGESAIPSLVQVFKHGEPSLRCFAAMALKELDRTPSMVVAIDGELEACPK